MYCERYKATIKDSVCVARQKKIQSGDFSNGLGHLKKYECMACNGCKDGEELMKKKIETDRSLPCKYRQRCKADGRIMLSEDECKICKAYIPDKESQVKKTKICSKCGKEKDIDLFYANKKSKDGKMGQCKRCFDLMNAVRKIKQKEEKLSKKQTEPVEKTPKPVEKPEDTVEKQVETFVCTGECGLEKELTPENFQRNASNRTGFDTVCKTCRNKMRRKNPLPGLGLTIDFTHHSEMLSQIKNTADREFRTPEQQVLYYINAAINGQAA